MKKYNVTSCITCPFCVEINNYESIRYDTLYFCQLKRRDGSTDSHIASCDYIGSLPEELVSKVLDDCPLKEGGIKIKLL